MSAVANRIAEDQGLAPFAGAVARWLCREMPADEVLLRRFERLPGGAIQDDWSLEVDVVGGPTSGAYAFVLRTDAPSGVSASLSRPPEFAVLRLAHANALEAHMVQTAADWVAISNPKVIRAGGND